MTKLRRSLVFTDFHTSDKTSGLNLIKTAKSDNIKDVFFLWDADGLSHASLADMKSISDKNNINFRWVFGNHDYLWYQYYTGQSSKQDIKQFIGKWVYRNGRNLLDEIDLISSDYKLKNKILSVMLHASKTRKYTIDTNNLRLKLEHALERWKQSSGTPGSKIYKNDVRYWKTRSLSHSSFGTDNSIHGDGKFKYDQDVIKRNLDLLKKNHQIQLSWHEHLGWHFKLDNNGNVIRTNNKPLIAGDQIRAQPGSITKIPEFEKDQTYAIIEEHKWWLLTTLKKL